MKHEEKIEFLSEQFESEKQQIPVSLEKENVVSMLESVDISKRKKARIIPIKRYASLAAALMVVVAVAVLSKGFLNKDSFATQTEQTEQAEETRALSGIYSAEVVDVYAEIEKYFLSEHEILLEEIENEQKYSYGTDDLGTNYTYAVKNESAASDNASDLGAYGKTNTQVSGIDEGDIIKNDGKYIYTVAKNKVYIVDAESMKLTAVISDFAKGDYTVKTELNIDEIYVQGDILAVTATEQEYYPNSNVYNGPNIADDWYYPIDTSKSKVYIAFYDISDRTKPTIKAKHTQSGIYQDSRLVDDILYTVAYYTVDVSHNKTEDQIKTECVPKIDGKRIDAENIMFTSDYNDDIKSYVVVSSFDLNNKSENNSSYACLGDVDNIYMSRERLYIVSTGYDTLISDSNLGSGYLTVISALKLDSGKISYEAEGSVSGRINDQYNMDEYNGYFRIVTTDFKEEKNDVIDISSIYVLNNDLNVVGKLVDIAENEAVESVRFMKDTAYIVTFKNTDPLFIADLSDPTSPKITGKVKLPGFSSYLHPINDSYLVGIGYDGDEESAKWDTVKITLFDVSDPKNPKVADEYVIDKAECDINYDPKAFVYYPEKELMGIPVAVYDTDLKSHCAYYYLSLEDGKIYEKAVLNHGFNKYDASFADFFRGTYISDTAYTVTEKGICSFNIDTADKLGELKFEEKNT